MPAPTALQRAPEKLAEELNPTRPLSLPTPTDEPILDLTTTSTSLPPQATTISLDDTMHIDPESRPTFAPETVIPLAHRAESRKVPVPPHRMTPLKSHWPKIYPPLVEHLKLQVRMNVKAKAVELRTSKFTTDSGALQKGEDFVKAFTLGFDVDDVSFFTTGAPK